MEKLETTELGYQQFCLFYTLDIRKTGEMLGGMEARLEFIFEALSATLQMDATGL